MWVVHKMGELKPEEMPAEESAWNMFAWRFSIPLCDDLWLGMQAQNIAIVDRIVRHFESAALEEFYKNDRFSMDDLYPLSAMSQVWVFALYEFLRTWLQRASKLIGYAEQLAVLKTNEERAAYLKTIEGEAQEKAKHVKLASVFYHEHVARVGDEKFVKSLRHYRDSIKELFRDVEAIRMPLAKHEIAGAKDEQFMAEAPGYGRVDVVTGSMYWQIVLADSTVDIINRHSLADRFFGTEKPKERSALFAEDAAEPHLSEGEKVSDAAEPGLSEREKHYLDWFFGTVNDDEQPYKRRRRRGRRGGRRNRKLVKTASKAPVSKSKAAAPKRRQPEGSGGGW